MIRINLLGEKVDNTLRNLIHGTLYLSATAIALFACIVTHASLESELDGRNQEKALLTRKLQSLEKVTKQIDDLEKNKKTLQEKLQTIAMLKARKQGPVHVLDNVNQALPERAWLLALKEKSGALEVQGIALDNQTISSFMSNLEKLPYFRTVDLVLSTDYEKDSVKLKQFTLSVGLKSALDVQREQQLAETTQKKPI